MNAFDKVIGYDTIKNELLQVCDMIKNREIYKRLGAKFPQGVLLSGDPGLGKTLLAECFIQESGLEAYTVRRNKGTDDFVEEIIAAFRQAKEKAPAIVFLDDMDKFANEDDRHRDAREYVAVQAGIDEVKGCDVLVLATVNEPQKLPISLIRSGRFDRKIRVCYPTEEDALNIIDHYLSDKQVSDKVDRTDLSKMIAYCSCAELETILNEAAIYAAHKRKDKIETEDLIRAVLRMQYASPDNFTEKTPQKLIKTALHEAGHLVVSEVLCEGSVGLASIRSSGRDATGGFIHRCKELTKRSEHIMISLAGKAAVELYYADEVTGGCARDINRAVTVIRSGICENASSGFGMVNVATAGEFEVSENMNARNEAVVQAELERYMRMTQNVLLNNRGLLEKAAAALLEKETLLYSDIRKLRNEAMAATVAG